MSSRRNRPLGMMGFRMLMDTWISRSGKLGGGQKLAQGGRAVCLFDLFYLPSKNDSTRSETSRYIAPVKRSVS